MNKSMYNDLKELIEQQKLTVNALTKLMQSEAKLLNAIRPLDTPKESTLPQHSENAAPQIPPPPRYEGVSGSGPGWFYVQPTNIGKEPEPPKPAPAPKKSPIEQIREFCRENGIRYVDPEKFFKYYNDRHWKDNRGEKITNWKALVRSWENREKKKMGGAVLATDKSLKEPNKIYGHIQNEFMTQLAEELKEKDRA